MSGKKPDYNLCVRPRGEDKFFNQIGAAWEDEFGGISIKLNPCVVLSHADDVVVKLFVNNKERKTTSGRHTSSKSYTSEAPPEPPPMSDDEDVPF